MKSINRINECHNLNGRALPRNDVVYLVIHHCSLARKTLSNPRPIPDELLTGPELARIFRGNPGLGTARRTPYHIFITYPDGIIEQILPLCLRGAHALAHNNKSWGICTGGEGGLLTERQRGSLVWVCRALYLLNGERAIIGHDELIGGKRDPNKVCPGYDLKTIIEEVHLLGPTEPEGIAP